MHILERFYSAMAERDHATMAACYHAGARFSDPVFPDLDVDQVRAMWRMLLTSGTDLRIEFEVSQAGNTNGKAICHAWYTFTRTGRGVHNVIRSRFELKDRLILVQQDEFDFWRWSRQALGTTGLLLGWTPWVRGKVRASAAASLRKAMSK